ncbi:MAG: hypothetical protein ACYDGN_06310 [Acidimicrobiales bacterium]
MTALTTAPVVSREPSPRVSWKALARVTWAQRRSTLVGLLGVFVACAIAMVLGEAATHGAYASYLANRCAKSLHSPCVNVMNWFANHGQVFSAMVIALHVLPAVIGVFVGAPLVARELESGTFRFTWTQGAGRSRSVVTPFVFLATFVVVATFVLGLVLNGFAHPFEVVGDESQWAAGLFDTTGPMLAAWALFALALGTFLGAVIGRIVAAMAATAVSLGGLLVLWFGGLVSWLESIGARSMTIKTAGPMIGKLDMPGGFELDRPGTWLVQGWFSGQGGHRLSVAASNRVMNRIFLFQPMRPKGTPGDVIRWLSAHHYVYWVSYQPVGRFWIFQSVAVATLVCLAVLLTFGSIGVVRRRS